MIKILKCSRCSHEWASKLKQPKQCPACRSPYWNKPKVKEFRMITKAELEKAAQEYNDAHKSLILIYEHPTTMTSDTHLHELITQEKTLHTKFIKLFRLYTEQRKAKHD